MSMFDYSSKKLLNLKIFEEYFLLFIDAEFDKIKEEEEEEELLLYFHFKNNN
jgi:hypothetical protein